MSSFDHALGLRYSLVREQRGLIKAFSTYFSVVIEEPYFSVRALLVAKRLVHLDSAGLLWDVNAVLLAGQLAKGDD